VANESPRRIATHFQQQGAVVHLTSFAAQSNLRRVLVQPQQLEDAIVLANQIVGYQK
jgi:hypothetical protein